MALIERDVLVSEILAKTAGNPHQRVITDQLSSALPGDGLVFTEKNDQAEKWLSWAKTNTYLKLVSQDIPAGILPDGHHGQLTDVRVFTKYGPDDSTYDNHRNIREKVARGNSILHLNSGLEPGYRCVIYGLKKFTGGLGDDDDKDKGDNHTWKKYFTKPLEEADTVIATRKANGEAAHFSCIHLDGQFIICGGSKNVHMLIRNRGDIKRYTEDRFTVAREVCDAIMDLLESMEEEVRNRLLSFLCLTGYTAIFEILNPTHQHVEDLSHLPKSQLCFITWTSNNLEPSDQSQLCCMPPHIAIEVARALGVPTVQYDVIPVTEVEERMCQIRQGYQYEGEVLYFIQKEVTVIGLLKKKTIWYIICRAIREKVKAACNSYRSRPDSFSMSVSVGKMNKRLKEIQSWLGLDEESLQQWKELADKFLRWCMHNVQTGHFDRKEVADMFPVIWGRYLKETDQSDRITSQWSEPKGSDD